MTRKIFPKIPSINALCYILGIKESVLNSLLSNTEKYYYKDEKIKVDGKGHPILDKYGNPKIRILFPSKGLLKEIQTKIRRRILTQIDYPTNIKGGVKGQDNIKNARFHLGNKYKFSTDLKDFFPSISETMVTRMFIRIGYYPKIAKTLAKLVTYQGCVPQGTPTSTDVANLVFFPIDEKLIAFCSEKNIKYSRYVDDLTFSACFEFKNEALFIIKLITPYFNINRKKTFFTSGKAKITGIVVGNNTLDTDELFNQKISEDASKYKDGISPRLRYRKRVRNAMKESNVSLKIASN